MTNRPPVQPTAETGLALNLRALLADVTERVESAARLSDRVQSLFQAVLSIGSHLELDEVLQHIVDAAVELVDARYGALGVLDPATETELARFITVGIDPDEAARIGELPHGRGVLGLLIREPHPIRIHDLTSDPAAVGFPPNHPPMHTFLGVPINVGSEAFGNLYLTEKRGGGDFTDADERVLVTLATAAGLAVQNARLYESGQRRQYWLEATSSLSLRLLAGIPTHEVFPEVVAHARTLAHADVALLALARPDDTLVVAAVDGPGSELIQRRVVPVESMTSSVARTGSPIAVHDAPHDSRVWQGLLDGLDVGPVLWVPLGREEEALGALVVARSADGHPFDDDVLRVVETFAAQAAIALRLGAAATDREQLAVLGDRDRIARDLHDLVIQRLFAVGLSLEGTLRASPADAAARVSEAVVDLDATIKEIRTTIFALQSRALATGRGLRDAVLKTAGDASRALGFEPSVSFTGPVDTLVDDHLGEQLLAVLREALANVARHAQAGTADVEIFASTDEVGLTVADNGRGIEHPPRGGLQNLASRAAVLGGLFTAGPRPEGGTLVRWSVPLDQP